MRLLTLVFLSSTALASDVLAAWGPEYLGQFASGLVANKEDHERVIFKNDSGSRLSNAGTFEPGTHFSMAKLQDPRSEQFSLTAFLVEEEDVKPVMYVDLNDSHTISPDEKIVLKRSKPNNPYLWEAMVMLPLTEGIFKSCPVYLQYFKEVTTEKMGPEDRLVLQSTEVLARGTVNVKGKPITVQYAYTVRDKSVNPESGWLGGDIDESGDIDMDNLSPEAAKADDETVVFRVGDTYLSTKKADVSKNQIILREHDAKDYKRLELYLNKDFPDFGFTDFEGKKHRLSEFRGQYVLLDIWGFWCGPCLRELPYIREAYRRFQTRKLQIVGLNTDPDYTVDSMKKSLTNNGMLWTQGQFQSVTDFLRGGLRVNSFPTTFLISPEGKILSMSRSDRDEPDLRQQDLLKTLDEILPKP